MKLLFFPFKKGTFLFLITFLSMFFAFQSHAQFAQTYGSSANESFIKIIQSGTNYYSLGRRLDPVDNVQKATITRMNNIGLHLWTVGLNIGSEWTDAALTPTGELIVIGYTLPFNSTTKSIMGLITPTGTFTWVRSYDVTGRDLFYRIVRSPLGGNFPYYIVGAQKDPVNSSATWDDIVLLNVNAAGTINWKRKFTSNADDEFFRDLEVLPNGDLVICGNSGNNGIILKLDSNGLNVNAATPENITFSYTDLSIINNVGYYAVGETFPAFIPYLIKYDNDFIPLWHVSFTGLTDINQVWHDPATGRVFVTGKAFIGGQTRSVLIRLFEATKGSPAIEWVRYLDKGETAYVDGSFWFLSPNQIAFADGRIPAIGGYGGVDAFLHINNMDLLSCMTKSASLNLQSRTHIYNSPDITSTFFDVPRGVDILSSSKDWKSQDACQIPCDANFTFQNLTPCGNIQFTNQSTGAAPLTYSWNFGDPSSGANNTSSILHPTHQFSICGNFRVCLKITAGDGCMDSICQTVTYFDNVKPVITCPPNLTINCNTSTLPPVTGSASATDNCMLSSALGISYTDKNSGFLPCNGIITRTWEASDICNNTSSCVQTIHIRDTTNPTIYCPQDRTIQCNLNNPPSAGLATATDNCTLTSNIILSNSDVFTGQVPCKVTITRTWTAEDACKNKSTCIQIIKMVDTIPPTISCPRSPTVNTNPGLCYFTGSYPGPTANDSCDSNPTIVCSLITTTSAILITPNTQYPKGVNTITCYAVDACGNQSKNCDFTLTVEDNEPPKITCPPSMTVLGTWDSLGRCKAIVNNIAPTVMDNCPMTNYGYQLSGATVDTGRDEASGIHFMSGVTTVTYLVIDMGINKDTCRFTINVRCEPSPCDLDSLNSGLVGYFPFLNNANDLSLTSINGSVVGPNLTVGQDNINNSAYHFNGFGQYINCGTNNRNITNKGSKVSIMAWIKTTERNQGQWIAGKYEFTERKGYGIAIGDNNSNNLGKVAIGGRDGVGNNYYSSGYSYDTVNDGKWHCIVGTVGNGVWSIYIDGNLQSSALGGTNDLTTSANVPFTIGAYTGTNTLSPLYMNGDIDNVLIYNRILSQKEIDCLCPGNLPLGNSCICGSFSNLSARIHQGSPNQSIKCGDTISLNCPFLFQFGGEFHCQGQACERDAMDWKLDGPGIDSSGTLFAASFMLPLDANNFSVPGLYTLTLIGYCNGIPCPPCKIYFEVKECSNPCDSLKVMPHLVNNPTVEGKCCYSVAIKNNLPSPPLNKICVNLISTDWIFTPGSIIAGGWNIVPSGTNQFCLTYTWGGAPSIPVGVLLWNEFIFCLEPTNQNASSTQQLVFDWYSGNQLVCKDSMLFDCNATYKKGCCRDSISFFNTVANFNPLGEVGDCIVIMNGTGLDSCKQITWSWGDSQTTGPVSNATAVSHIYSGTGTYNICYLIEEFDANGKVCWSYKKCDSVYVICGDCDSVSLSVIPSSQNGDTCCYKLYLNNTNSALISNIHINAHAPVTFIGANPALGWQVGPGPSLLQWALASGGTLPTGTNILIGTFCIKAQGQFPQNFTVKFLELVGPNNFNLHCVDTLITECRADSCVCGSFDNLSVRLFPGAQNLTLQCGKTYLLDCPPVFQFGGDFNCKGNDCDSTNKVEWNINGPSGGGGTVLAGPGITLPLNASSFSQPGLYTLTLVGYCDGKPCPPCIIYFESKGCKGCCRDSKDFFNTVANFQTNGALGDCQIFMNGIGLDSCMQVTWVWGDGDSTGPVSNSTSVSHIYSGTSTYNVCYIIEEVDINGKVCWSKMKCDSVYVICDTCCEESQNIISNGSFINQPAGNLLSTSLPWYAANLTPQIGTGDSCSTPRVGQLWGNSAVGEVMGQTSPGLFKSGWTYRIEFCAKFININNLPPNLRHGWFNLEAENGAYTGIGALIGQSPVLTQHDVWTNVCLPDWTPTANYDGLFINFQNTSTANHGDSVSWGRIDDICIQVVDSTCCADSLTFTNLMNQGFTINKTNCKVTVTAPQFDSCYYFGTPPALNGGIVSQVITDPSGSWMFTFTQSGIHQVCVTVFDECNSKQMCTRFEVKCDTCECAGADHLSFGGHDFVIPTTCNSDKIVDIPCDANGQPFYFHGNVLCKGDSCLEDNFSWIIKDSTGKNIIGGFDPIHLINPNTGHFDINNLNAALFTPGMVYTITVTWYCDGKKCTCDIKFRIKDCDCKCGKFENVFLRPIQGAQSIPVKCDGDAPTVHCPTPGKPFNISGQFTCAGDDCPTNTQVDWILFDPLGNKVDSGITYANNAWSLNLNAHHFGKAGTYTLLLSGHCGSKLCTCKIRFTFKEPCPCDDCTCGKFSDMFIRSGQGPSQPVSCGNDTASNIEIFGTSCEACYALCAGTCTVVNDKYCWCNQGFTRTKSGVKIPCPPNGQNVVITGQMQCNGVDCPETALIDWVLLNPMGLPIASQNNVPATPNFAVHVSPILLTDTGDYTLQLISHCGKQECKCEIKFQMEAPCPDKCECDKFSIWSSISKGPVLAKNCGDTIYVPDGLKLFFSVAFNCKGVCPPYPPLITWSLLGPSGFTPSAGITSATPNINLGIDESTFTQPGEYALTLIGHCGNKECKCTITFIKQNDCCKDQEIFEQTVLSAIQVSTDPTKCKAIVTIGKLPACDYIEKINWGDGTSSTGPFVGGDMPMHIYTTSGVYSISIIAVEEDPIMDMYCFVKLIKEKIEIRCGVPHGLDINSQKVSKSTINSTIKMHPNPTTDILNLELPTIAEINTRVRIIDLAGKKLYDQPTSNGTKQQTLQVGFLPSGLYFIQIEMPDKKMITEKFVKQ